MSSELLRRMSVVVGGGVFVLALIAQFSRVEPGLALLLSVGAGVGLGLAIYVVGSVATMSPGGSTVARPVAVAPKPKEEEYSMDGVELPAALQGEAAGSPAAKGEPGTEKVAGGGGKEGPDLHQTVRLDDGGVEYVLPEISPEELFREREGIDEEFLKQGMGIDQPAIASENTGKGTEGGT